MESVRMEGRGGSGTVGCHRLAVWLAASWVGVIGGVGLVGLATAQDELVKGIGGPRVKAQDWVTTGWDCRAFAAWDVNGDGRDEVLTVNGSGQLCAAYSVGGWKASPWEVIADGMPASAVALLVWTEGEKTRIGIVGASEVKILNFDRARSLAGAAMPEWLAGRKAVEAKMLGGRPMVFDDAGGAWAIVGDRLEKATPPKEKPDMLVPGEPPAYEPKAAVLSGFRLDVDGDEAMDLATVWTCHEPHEYRVVRVALGVKPGAADRDADGLSDAEERIIGSDPLDRDSDDDGLLDGWEVKGLPRGVSLGDSIATFDRDNLGTPAGDHMLSPMRQDVLVLVSRYEQIEEAALAGQLIRAAKVYRQNTNRNPDGTTGVWVHTRIDAEAVKVADQGHWGEVGGRRLGAMERGIYHWMQVGPGGGGQAMQTGDMGGSGNHWAAFAHEVGHQLSLSHEGDSTPAWCPLYPSMMNYAFNYSIGGDPEAVGFSDGKFRATVLNENALLESLPYSYESLKYLAAPPFRFTLKAADEDENEARDQYHTLIDWNQNGVFDEGPVRADINYGGSTHGGVRRNHERIASSPSLAVIGGRVFMAATEEHGYHTWIKRYEGGEKWTDAKAIANSASDRDPLLVGSGDGDAGFLFIRRVGGWMVASVKAAEGEGGVEVGAFKPLAGLPRVELSAAWVRSGEGDPGRVLLVSRFDDDRLEARWLVASESPSVSEGQELVTQSRVAVGIAQEPTLPGTVGGAGRIVIASSMPNPRGADLCLRVTEASIDGDLVQERELAWTRGETSGNQATTRPVVAFMPGASGSDAPPQLVLFHTGWPDENGQMIAYRTTRIGNQALDEGWLTCMMYDIWTRTRVGVGFASTGREAVYAFRWDSGDHGDTRVNTLLVAHNGWGLDGAPMRDFDDVSKISLWGIRHSILNMRR